MIYGHRIDFETDLQHRLCFRDGQDLNVANYRYLTVESADSLKLIASHDSFFKNKFKIIASRNVGPVTFQFKNKNERIHSIHSIDERGQAKMCDTSIERELEAQYQAMNDMKSDSETNKERILSRTAKRRKHKKRGGKINKNLIKLDEMRKCSTLKVKSSR